MIETRPWMGARDLWSVLSRPILPDDAKLARHWAQDGDRPFWFSRSSWGMAAVADALAEHLGRDVRVWVPEYFCDQALWPIRQQRTSFHFYPVDDRGRPAWERLDTKTAPPDLFLLVHFFGHASDDVQARAFCDQHGALLIEDATQVLGPDGVIGREGDFVFYSPWKFFPVPNGALMLVRPRARRWLEPVSRAMARLGTASSPGFQWLKQAALSKLPRAGAQSIHGDFFGDPEVVEMPLRPRPSPVSKPVFASVNLADAGRRRRENDAATRAFFAGLPGWQPFDETPASGPIQSVFRLNSPELASAAHDALREVGVRVGSWPGLPPEVSDPQSHAVRLRRTVLSLPCHQELTPARLVDAFRRSGLGAA